MGFQKPISWNTLCEPNSMKRARRDRIWMPVSPQKLNRWPDSSRLQFVTNHTQTITDFLQRPIPWGHEEQRVMNARVKTTQFLSVQISAKVRRVGNPSHFVRLNPACQFNSSCTSIGRNYMLLFIFPLSDVALWRIHLVLIHCFKPPIFMLSQHCSIETYNEFGIN